MSRTFCAELRKITGVSTVAYEYESMVQTVPFDGSVNMWPNMVFYLSIIIINDNSVQMSVKQIPLYIKTKCKFHDNLGHKEHSTHSPYPHVLFLNLSQILTPSNTTPP
jgi:hypothetical protein